MDFDKFPEVNILCVGDIMLDEYVYGEVNRISPEAPIPILNVKDVALQLGGAGNTARNMAALGARVTFCSIIGDDEDGSKILRLMKDESRITPYILLNKHRQTIKKTRYVAGSQQMIRVDREKMQSLSQDQAGALTKLIEQELPKHDILVISDYNKGVLTDGVLTAAINEANKALITVIVDPKIRPTSIYAGATIITPNWHEFEAMDSIYNSAVIHQRARDIMNRFKIKNMLITRGDKGVSIICEDYTKHLPAMAHEICDVSGAGDTVVATLAVAMASGAYRIDSVKLANLAAGIVVGKRGTATVSREELTERWRGL